MPAPKSDQQIIREVLGLAPPTPPSGPPRRMLRITLEGDFFPEGEQPYEITIGDQRLAALAVGPGGQQASGLIERAPAAGEQIALVFPTQPLTGESGEGRVMLAGNFDPALLDSAIA